MRLNLTICGPGNEREHVILTADPETPIDEVTRALSDGRARALYVRGAPVAGSGSLASSGIRDGDMVSVGAPRKGTPNGAGYQLAVVGGRLSGRSWALSPGSTTVGRTDASNVRIDDPAMSRQHFRLTLHEGCTVEDLGSRNGTFVDGRPARGAVPVGPGNVIEAGASILQIRPLASGDADVSKDEPGVLAFNRPARIRPAARDTKVEVPARAAEREPHPFPWAQVLAPIAFAMVAAVAFRRPEAMLFALMSPVLAISSALTNRRRDEARAKKEADRFAADLSDAEVRITEATSREVADLRYQFPDPVTLHAVATGPGRRLWERRAEDVDALLLRVGVADRPASIVVTSKGHDRPPPPTVLPAVPVAVDLGQAGVLGIAGANSNVRSLARWLVAQLAVLRSPRDLQVVLLAGADSSPDWEWLRWLPHVRTDDTTGPIALVGTDRVTREERVKELLRLLDVRAVAAKERHSSVFTPTVVVVFDGVRALRSVAGVARILRDGPQFGILTIGLDSDVNRLAEEGRAQVALDADHPTVGSLDVDGADPVAAILIDHVGADWAEGVARGLCPVRDVGGDEGDAVVPSFVRFVDLAGIDLNRVDDVEQRWSRPEPTTRALVGMSMDGPFSIDLKRDGPHALVAGTTGSGKSEFLQTLVVSLATANRPSAINFVLVDYKGASAFADCERLPHTVGMVTNLDGHLTERALASLDAELERREHVLKDLGAPDVDTAWERDPARAGTVGLARLVLVIDEFKELVQELPDFVSGLIRIARVGRSLGVHLVLATQRPTGVVSPEMRANTGLRVALRMEDKADSAEVLEAPHAADISRSTPGRGYVRTGGQAALVEFQSARVAGRRKGVTTGLPPPEVHRVPWKRVGYPLPVAARPPEPKGSATDLHSLVTLIADAAARLQIAESPSPWLPPLPSTFSLPPAPIDGKPGPTGPPPVTFGIEDLPSQQVQRPALFDVVHGGHLLVAGSSRSGRSTALRTLAASLAQAISPSDLHLYGLDFGNGALLPLADLPHCGAVVTRSESDRVERLLARLTDEATSRQELLARSGFGDIGEQREAVPAEARLPYMVVLVDRWEGFNSQFGPETGSELPGAVVRLVREGIGVGLRFVVAGDRSLLIDRLASQVEDKLVLRLSDRNDYRMVNINPRNIPEEVPPGRAFRGESGSEVQFALLGQDPSAQSQAAALRTVARAAAKRWPEKRRTNRPFRVDVMPSSIEFEEASKLAEPVRPKSPLWAMVGVGGDDLTTFGVDLAVSGAFVIGGPSRTGRSTALLCMARSLLAGGTTLIVLCPRPSPLQTLHGRPGVTVFSGAQAPGSVAADLGQIAGPLAVLVDDAEALARSETDEELKAYLRSAPPGQVAAVVAGQLEDMKMELRGVIGEAKKAKTGLLLSPPSTLDGDLVGLRLSRNQVGRMPPGRGLLALHGEAVVVQVPT